MNIVNYRVFLFSLYLPKGLHAVPCRNIEALANTLACFGTHPHTRNPMLQRKGSQLLLLDLYVLAIHFVGQNNNLHLLLGIFFNLIHPKLLKVLKGLSDLQVEYQHNSLSIFIISTSNGPKSFLTSSVPNLQFDSFIIKFQSSTYLLGVLKLKINTNGGKIALLERIVCKSTQNWWLSYWTVAD